MADNFDLRLLNAVQRDDSRTADSLSGELDARDLPLIGEIEAAPR